MTAPDDRRPDGAPGPAAPDVSGPTDPDAIRADIDATREQLGATVDELNHRLDVPARAKQGATRARDTAMAIYRANPPAALGGGAAVLAALVGLTIWRARRRATKRAATRAGKRGEKQLAAQLAAAVRATNQTSGKARKKARRATGKKR